MEEVASIDLKKEHQEKISKAIAFNSQKKISALNIVKKIIDSDAEGLFLITNSIHGALICQHLRRNKSKIKIINSSWGFTDPEFIRHGGKAVEGVISLGVFNGESKRKSFINFKKKYENRFKERLSEPAQIGYESARLLISGLLKTDDPKKLKQTILKQKSFTGVNGKIIIDQYGEPIRTMYILQIKNKKIKLIGKIEPSNHLFKHFKSNNN